MNKRKVYTTGQAAKILHVAPRTVAKACDKGLLKHYRIMSDPAKEGDRRILHEDLLAYMKETGIPAAILNSEAYFGLLVGQNDKILSSLQEHAGPDWVWLRAESAFDAGAACRTRPPDRIVFDAAGFVREGIIVLKEVTDRFGVPPMALILPDDGLSGELPYTFEVAVMCGDVSWIDEFVRM